MKISNKIEVCNKIVVYPIMLKLVLCYYDYVKEHMFIDYNYTILVNFVNYSKLHYKTLLGS